SASPPNVSGAKMAHLETTGLTYLFGGIDSTEFSITDAMWAFDGSDWSEVARTSPWPGDRQDAFMFADDASDVLLLTGGRTIRMNLSDPCPVGAIPDEGDLDCRYSDLWVFDGTSWAQLQGAERGIEGPSSDPAFAYSNTSRRMVAFGSIDDNDNTLIELPFANSPAHYVSFQAAALGIAALEAQSVQFSAYGSGSTGDGRLENFTPSTFACDVWSANGWRSAGTTTDATPIVLSESGAAAQALFGPDGTLPLRCATDPSAANGEPTRSILDAVAVEVLYRE
ncbi:MAG: hypothetical protein AAF658_00380, partial [Myxococcota bacterium]